jgi:uncharacterized protein (TIGR02001 family)
MKKILMVLLLLGSLPSQASPVSYNIGYMSDYWYRGVFQSESAVSFGADIDTKSSYAGIWMADVDQGIEMDVYLGTTFKILGFDSYAGVTGYYYSDNFDSDYEEFNTGLSYGGISYDYSVGNYKTATEQDYSWAEVTIDFTNNLSLSYGEWGKDLKGSVTKVNYNKTISDIDFGLEVGKNDSDSTGTSKYVDTTYATFSLGISF